MKILKHLSGFLLILVAAIVCSCSSDLNRNKVEYLPFRETKNGQWGMVSMDGKELFTDEFKNEPTVVRDGRFFVKNGEGLWELYEASEHPQKIGGEYVYTSGFSHGHALVSERNKPVTLINTSGEVVKELDRIANRKVLEFYTFEDGLAVFMTADSLFGAINEDGDCVIQPEYAFLRLKSPIAFGIKAKYKKNISLPYNKKLREEVKYTIFDFEGNTIDEVKESNVTAFEIEDSKYAISVKKGDEERWTIYNSKGESVYKCTGKVQNIKGIQGDNFIYFNGEGWGLMNFKGETLIRAKYESLDFDGDHLIAGVKKGDNTEYKIIDIKDQQIGSEKFDVLYFSQYLDGEHLVAKLGDDEYSIIDENGTMLKNLPDMVECGFSDGDYVIKSDYVDLEKLLSQLGLTASGIDGFSFNTLPETAVQRIANMGFLSEDSEHSATDPYYWYDFRNLLTYSKDIEGITTHITIVFYNNLSQENYQTKRVVDYADEYYTYYHDEQQSTGYTWNKTKPRYFSLKITNDGKMRGKLRLLFNKIVAHLQQMGTLAKGNNGAKVFNLKNNMRALLTLESNAVTLLWGDINSEDNIDIEQYKDNKENVTFESSDNDTMVEDSTVVDSAVAY